MNLSPQQRIVFAHLLGPMHIKKIASQLGIAEGTVKQHAHEIYIRLGCAGRHELMARYMIPSAGALRLMVDDSALQVLTAGKPEPARNFGVATATLGGNGNDGTVVVDWPGSGLRSDVPGGGRVEGQ